MGYAHIDNLYKNQIVLAFRECFALEKIHGTSARIRWADGKITLSSGGANSDQFNALFDATALGARFLALFTADYQPVMVYGEAYGGKMQGMKATYGDALRFVAFEVAHGSGDALRFEPADRAAEIVKALGLEFVHFARIPTDIVAIDAERDAPSVQAERNGCAGNTDRMGFSPPIREGVVLRPVFEVRLNSGARVIAKHKRAEFAETKTPRAVDPTQQQVLADAEKIADEWVTPMRLEHVAEAVGATGIEHTGAIIKAMVEDVIREAGAEIVDSKAARKAIGSATVTLWKNSLGRRS